MGEVEQGRVVVASVGNEEDEISFDNSDKCFLALTSLSRFGIDKSLRQTRQN